LLVAELHEVFSLQDEEVGLFLLFHEPAFSKVVFPTLSYPTVMIFERT